MKKGFISQILSYSCLDGPGRRSVVFLSGCPMQCGYCHNPETWKLHSGTQMYSDEVLQQIERYKPYIEGVTISGGEPLFQVDFTLELLKGVKALGLNTAIDTSGSIINEKVIECINYADFILLDLKFANEKEYSTHTKIEFSNVIKFLNLVKDKKVIIRQVVIEGINDTKENIQGLKELIKPLNGFMKIDFLPFRKLCREKYERLKIPFRFEKYNETSNETILKMEKMFQECEP